MLNKMNKNTSIHLICYTFMSLKWYNDPTFSCFMCLVLCEPLNFIYCNFTLFKALSLQTLVIFCDGGIRILKTYLNEG